MTTLGLYFRGLTQREANDLRASINAIAARHGYVAVGGPTKGQGNAAELMVAIAGGEVALVLLADEERWRAIRYLDAEIEHLRESDFFTATALRLICDALKEAQERAATLEREEIEEYGI